MSVFRSEAEFEEALIKQLLSSGWNEVLHRPTEDDLLRNWADILFENNRGIDRLNDHRLTDDEMKQILEQIGQLRTPLRLNGFINGRTVSIKRTNPDDKLHYGKEVSLKIYDRLEIAGGQSRYQIAQQPVFKSKSKMLNDRRGDLTLLINGMPVIHIELKRSGVPVSQACYQIEKYSHEGVFTGIFSLVQIFVAMEPGETKYFANPGPDGRFSKEYQFNWADFNNEPINHWKDIVSTFLFIPVAHQLIGFYTVADENDGVLKVMRSYQYFAANAISTKVAKTDWKSGNALGGYIWHTTGSGKTMTSFKSAQLIANSKDADKVIFLMDRIELGTQSLTEYRGFADENEDVQATENTGVLVTKLKSSDPSNTLIVTSIQKMSNIKDEADGGLNAHDIQVMNRKRIVFIIDEAHRSTFGEMLVTIKETFPNAIFFGFTGTPIHEENKKHDNTTSTIFGNELHRYSIADGIRDKNVLGFDPYKVLTYRDIDLRRMVALDKAKASSEADALADKEKNKIYNHFMRIVPMARHVNSRGDIEKGIEDYIPKSQYDRPEHHNKVVEDIISNFGWLSSNKFHAIFATSSINDAIMYYRLFKEKARDFKVTALFDSSIDNNWNVAYKEDGLVEILEDYNKRYNQDYRLATHARFKKDVAARMAHKAPYLGVERTPEKQIDLLIVVDQMLTGFDSKWINTLYLDKVLSYENIIQAFSRTNRLYDESEKPFGTIRYYRYPHTMEVNIEDAVKLYSGDKPMGLFVDHLEANLNAMNNLYDEIKKLFEAAGVGDFSKLPEETGDRKEFVRLFKELNRKLAAARLQGFKWEQRIYTPSEGKVKNRVEVLIDETTYLILALRYKELFKDSVEGTSVPPYEIDGSLTVIDTGKIDTEYMNSTFKKFIKILRSENVSEEELELTLSQLFKSFASLTQEEQKYANLFIHEVQSGDAELESGKSFRDYVNDYMARSQNDRIKKVAQGLGLYENKLRELVDLNLTDSTIDDYGHYQSLKSDIDREKAKAFMEAELGKPLAGWKVISEADRFLRDFLVKG